MRSHTIILIVRALERARRKVDRDDASRSASCCSLREAWRRACACRISSRPAALLAELRGRPTCGIYAQSCHDTVRMNIFPPSISLTAVVSCAGLNQKVYRQSWADKGYDPNGHHYLITRIGLRNQVAFGYRCWKGKVDAAPTTIKQPTKREWKVLPEFV